MLTRVCSQCGADKPITDYHRNGKDKEGNIAYRNDCKSCYTITRKISIKKHKKFVDNTRHRTGENKTLSLQDWKDVMIYFGGGCAYCGTVQNRKTKLTKDHVVPVSQGGATVKRNIIPACTGCNCSKCDSDLETWFRKQKFFSEERLLKIRRWANGATIKG
jgi:hypothetical protein